MIGDDKKHAPALPRLRSATQFNKWGFLIPYRETIDADSLDQRVRKPDGEQRDGGGAVGKAYRFEDTSLHRAASAITCLSPLSNFSVSVRSVVGNSRARRVGRLGHRQLSPIASLATFARSWPRQTFPGNHYGRGWGGVRCLKTSVVIRQRASWS